MSKIYELFYSIKHNAKNYLNAPIGKDFEERMMVQLNNIGYNRILKSDLSKEYISDIKKRILQNDEIISNETNFKQHYLYQPFGSQNYPDFIIFDKRILVSIESKFTEKNHTKPVWNSGIPRLNGLFIFGSYGKQDITFFRGCNVVSKEERSLFQQFFAEEKGRADSFNKQNMSNQEFGFSAYVRTAYEQKKMYNVNAILNFFDNDKRTIMEEAVLSYLQGL